MDIISQAKVLAASLRHSDVYRNYVQAKEKAFQLDANKQLIKRFKKAQFQIQTHMMNNEPVPSALSEEVQRMSSVIQFNRDVSDYIAAEYQFNQLMNEIFRILGDAVELDLSFMDLDS